MDDELFNKLLQFLNKVPSIESSIGTGVEEGLWWVKFTNHNSVSNVKRKAQVI